MSIPLGHWQSEGLQQARLAFERGRSVAQGIAGGVIGAGLSKQHDDLGKLSSISQNLIQGVRQRNIAQGTEQGGYQLPPSIHPPGIGEQVRNRTQARLNFLARQLGTGPEGTGGLSIEQLRAIQYLPDSTIVQAAAHKDLSVIPGEPALQQGRLGPSGFIRQLTEPVVPAESNPLSRVPVVGESLGRMTSPLTSPLGAGLAAAFPEVTVAGIVGGTIGGTAGGALESAGVPVVQTPIGGIGPRSVGELAGSIAGPAVESKVSPVIASNLRQAVESAGGGRGFIAAEAGGTQLPSDIPPMSWRRVLKDIAQGNESTADNAAIRQAAEAEIAKTGRTPGELMASGPPTEPAMQPTPPATTFPGVTDKNLEAPLDKYFARRGQYLSPALRRTYKAAGFSKSEIDQIAAGEFPELLPPVSGAGGLTEQTTQLRKQLLAERGKGFFGQPLESAAGGAAPPGGQPPTPPVQPEPLQPGETPTSLGATQHEFPNLLEDVKKVIPQRSLPQRAYDELVGAIGTTLTSVTSADIGSRFRNSFILGIWHPKEWIANWNPVVKSAFSEQAAQDAEHTITTDTWLSAPNVQQFDPKAVAGARLGYSKLHMYEHGIDVEPGERVPGFTGINESVVSHAFRKLAPWTVGSERNLAVDFNLTGHGAYKDEALRFMEAGITDPKQYEQLASALNHARLYGDWNPGRILPGINALFSGRALTGRLQVYLDPFVKSGSLFSPSARQVAAKNLVGMVAGDMALLGIGSATLSLVGLGNQIQTNPASKGADWLKLRVGDTRLDPWQGFLPMMRLMSHMGLAAVTDTGGPDTGYSMGDVRKELKQFFSNKESPAVKLFTDVTGMTKPFSGKKILSTQTLVDLWAPFFAQDVYDSVKSQGLLGVPLAAPGAVGVNVQTYAKSPTSVVNDYTRYQGLTKDQEDNIYKFRKEVEYEWNRAKAAGADLSQSDVSTILGQQTGRADLGKLTSLAIENKIPLNRESIQYAIDHQDDLDAKTLLRIVPDEILRRYLTPSNFDRVFKQ